MARSIAGRTVSVSVSVSGDTRQRTDVTDRATIWTIRLLILAGVVREVLGQTFLVSFGFYTLHIIDPVVVLAGFATLLNIGRRRPPFDLLTVTTLVMAVLIISAAVRGLAVDPAGTLLNFRSNGANATVMLMAVTMRPSRAILVATERALVVSAVALIVLMLLRLATTPLLFMTYVISAADVNDGGRALSVFGVFMMGLTAGILLSDLLRSGRLPLTWRTALVGILPIMIVLSGQGTATLGSIMIVALVLLLERGPLRSVRLAAGSLAIILGVSLAAINMANLSDDPTLSHRMANLETRQLVWAALSEVWPTLPLGTQLFGYPGGATPPLLVYLNGALRYWGNSIHSMYYGALPMMGYVGLGAYLLQLASMLGRMVVQKLGRSRDLMPAYPIACVVGVLILSYTYEIRNENLLALVIPIWWLRALPGLRRDAADRQRDVSESRAAGADPA